MSYIIKKTYVWTCDRCQTMAETEANEDQGVDNRPGAWTAITWNSVKVRDLCPTCKGSFDRWWTNRGVPSTPAGAVTKYPEPGTPGSFTT